MAHSKRYAAEYLPDAAAIGALETPSVSQNVEASDHRYIATAANVVRTDEFFAVYAHDTGNTYVVPSETIALLTYAAHQARSAMSLYEALRNDFEWDDDAFPLSMLVTRLEELVDMGLMQHA